MAGAKRGRKKKVSDEPKVNLYQEFNKWVFDGDTKTPIPYPEQMLKYNSPINHTFMIRMFIHNAKGNYYLNTVFNNIGLRYMDIEEFFHFIKKCVIDFRFSRNQIPYFKWRNTTKLYIALRKKFPIMKTYEVEHLADLIEDSEDRDSYYSNLGLDAPKKLKSKKKIEVKSGVDIFISEHFKMVESE